MREVSILLYYLLYYNKSQSGHVEDLLCYNKSQSGHVEDMEFPRVLKK